MPNWVSNRVKAKDFKVLKEHLTRLATEEEKKELIEDGSFIEQTDEHRVVDFNCVIKMPNDLQIVAGGYEWIVREYFYDKEKYFNQNEKLLPVLSEIYERVKGNKEEFLAEFEKELPTLIKTFIEVYNIIYENEAEIKSSINNIVCGFYNSMKYKTLNWYDWSVKTWGTKWNACRCDINEDLEEIVFDTAYNIPIGVYIELSKYTPITVAYAAEDTGRNYGIINFNNGHLLVRLGDYDKSSVHEAVKIGEALACGGKDEEDIDLEYSKDNYTGQEIKEYFGVSRKVFLQKAHEGYSNALKIIKELF